MWSDLWPLLFTAVLTLAITLTVQLRVVPAVEASKRRADRWERDVLALGEFLSLEQRKVSRAVATGAMVRRFYVDFPPDTGDTKATTLARSEKMRYAEALDQYDSAYARIEWLIDRVESIDRTGRAITDFAVAANQFKGARLDLSLGGVWTGDESVDAVWDRERDAIQAMIQALKKLASDGPPRSALRRRRKTRV